MQKVYAVIHSVDYEGSDLHCIFSSVEKAESYVQKYIEKYPSYKGEWQKTDSLTWQVRDYTIEIVDYELDNDYMAN